MRLIGVPVERIPLLYTIALLLAACGGGGGGGEIPPPGNTSNLSVLAGESTGAGSTGSADGTGTAARFNQPNGIAADSAGNLYLADTGNSTIRKITPAAVVTTLAGMALSIGSTDGTGAAARFKNPESVVTDGSSNLYVGDGFPGMIRKITPAGVVTTFAGNTTSSSSVDGTGSAASFGIVRGVGIDSAGNIYVADALNHNIRMITPGAVVTTIAGLAGSSGTADGSGTAARFNVPSGIAIDSVGNIYVADTNNHTIRKITVSGGIRTVTTIAGTALSSGTTDGTGAAARFSFPRGLTVDGAGNAYVADFINAAIRKITPAGVVTTVVGVAGLGGFQMGALPGRIAGPFGVAISGTSLYIVTPNYSCVFLVTNRP